MRLLKWTGVAVAGLVVVGTVGITLAGRDIGTVDEGATPQTTTNFSHADRQIGGLSVDGFTTAPLRIVTMAHLDVPPKQAFDVVLTGLDIWVKDVERVEWDHTASSAPGVLDTGSLRTCFFGEEELTERIEYIEPGSVFAYSIVEERSNIPLPPSTNRLNVMMVESDGNGGSIVTWRFYFDKTFHPVSPVLETVMKRAFVYDSIQALADKNGGEVISPDL